MREKMTTLGESCQFFNGKAHEKDIDAEGKFVVVNSKFISTDGEVKKFTAKQMFPLLVDDIVMVMSDVPNGKALAKCYVIEENNKYSLNQRICAIRTTEFNIRFLYYQLNRHPYLLAFNNGENQTNLRKGDILNCPLWQPSLDVQEQIVKILDEALDQIEQAQSNIEQNIINTKDLFESYLQDEVHKIENLFGKQLLSEHLELITYGFTNPMPTTKEGPLKITAKDVNHGIVGWQNARHTSQDAFNNLITDKSRPIIGDLLLTKDGTLGRMGVVEISNLCINQSVALLRTNKKSLNPYFLKLILSSKPYQDLMISQAGGTTIKHIYITRVKKMLIPIPPIKNQNIILEKINHILMKESEILKNYDGKLKNLEELKKSILQKAFSGQLINQKQPITA